MKVAPKVIFFLEGADGFGTLIADALQPNPSSTLRRLEDSFELPLERYGIKDRKACGRVVQFVDADGLLEVSLLLLQYYEPPVLACAVNEALASLTAENLSSMPTVIFPFLVSAPKLKLESRESMPVGNASVYGMQVGLENDITQALLSRTQKLPSSLQIHHEPLACILQLARVLKLPAFILIGQSGDRVSRKNSGEELEVIGEMSGILASISSLSFSRERIVWNPTKISKETEEPWRALYG
ncbi:hypothetical protein RJ639_033306 [Escallonia herrerae]|uniref:DUF7894 domain-containing protein n=1 Tax=Escallonia herrerae TaxID=1293975 RepID=A0AA89BJJ8_9ASTE|nr:hypothetical protein RJ639_033306 [Escallonia herrerae]